MEVKFNTRRMLVALRKADWTKVWYAPAKLPDQDAEKPHDDDKPPVAAFYESPHARESLKNPLVGELNWLPHFNYENFEATGRKDKQHLQEWFLYRCWEYLDVENTEEAEAENQFNTPGYLRWQTWVPLADRYRCSRAMNKRYGKAVHIDKHGNPVADDGYESDEEGVPQQRAAAAAKAASANKGRAPKQPPKRQAAAHGKRKSGNAGASPAPKKAKSASNANATRSTDSEGSYDFIRDAPGANSTGNRNRSVTLDSDGEIEVEEDDTFSLDYDDRHPTLPPATPLNAKNAWDSKGLMSPPKTQKRPGRSITQDSDRRFGGRGSVRGSAAAAAGDVSGDSGTGRRDPISLSLRGREVVELEDDGEVDPVDLERVQRMQEVNGHDVDEEAAFEAAIRASRPPEDRNGEGNGEPEVSGYVRPSIEDVEEGEDGEGGQ